MVSNPERRTALLDAAIDVLAEEGARGLTFRTVDGRAGVPVGTASNYFSSRDDLLAQVGSHIYVRFTPDPAEVTDAMAAQPDRALVSDLMLRLTGRMTDNRNVYLALLELRLEATRRPELRETLTTRVRSDLESNVRFHLDAGLPGDRTTVLLLYLAMSGLLVEHLTLPGVLGAEGPLDDVVASVVQRIVPESN